MPPTIETSARDEEVDVAKAAEQAREWVRENAGPLNLLQFRIENIRQNGTQTRYVVICSIVPDLGKEREYYLIKVNVTTGKIVSPIGGRGKKEPDGTITFEEIKVDPKWTD